MFQFPVISGRMSSSVGVISQSELQCSIGVSISEEERCREWGRSGRLGLYSRLAILAAPSGKVSSEIAFGRAP